jgi:hypothetical protein
MSVRTPLPARAETPIEDLCVASYTRPDRRGRRRRNAALGRDELVVDQLADGHG